MLGITPTHSIEMRLHGQDGIGYQIETSTDLLSWQSLFSLTTSNGVAIFSHEGTNENALFFRRVTNSVNTNQLLQLQVSTNFSSGSVVTSDGCVVQLITSDLRLVTLTIPPGCVVNAQPFTMTLITNVVGLPFAQGSIGTVMLEPANFVLSGAASLEIDYQSGIDIRQLASFSANNDGSLFHMVMDRTFTNHVLIPITRFATYGTALATQTELDEIFNPSPSKLGDAPCDPDPNDDTPDTSQFPPSCSHCFQKLLTRALAVRSDLNQFKRCTIEQDVAESLTTARQQQLLGQPDNGSAALSSALTNICPFYEAKIAPLWTEAHDNCALGIVLFQFMLGFERQVQLLGETNLTDCSYTLFGNLANACASARECLEETAECCDPGGFKGPQKISEAQGIIRLYQLLGDTSCFPEDFWSDPDFQKVIQSCVTNAWLGTMTVSQTGSYDFTTNDLDATTTDIRTTEVHFDGYAWVSDEFPPGPGYGGYLNLSATGSGTVKLHETYTRNLVEPCGKGGTSQNYTEELTDTFGMTNFMGEMKTNDLSPAYGSYDFDIEFTTNKTYKLLTLGTDSLEVHTTVKTSDRNVVQPCPDGVAYPNPPINYTENETYDFPLISFPGPPLEFPMPDSSEVTGTYDYATTNFDVPEVVKTHFEWDFHRNTNSDVPQFFVGAVGTNP